MFNYETSQDTDSFRVLLCNEFDMNQTGNEQVNGFFLYKLATIVN